MTAKHEPFIIPLAELQDDCGAGGKAVNLARLHRLGIAVPDGFVLTDRALRLFIDTAVLQPAIDALCGALDGKSPLAVRCAAETISALVREESLPDDVDRRLTSAFEALGASCAIVRSSAIGEDSAAASFAGQLDSIAGVTTTQALRRAVVDVWASRWSDRVLSYELARKVSLTGMGVIVQRQIDAVISGVLFTRAPGDDREMLVKYLGGLGEALVSGRENPGRLTIARTNLRSTRLADPERAIPFEAERLHEGAIASLARTGLAIEAAFGGPQDIEWTMHADGTIWIVQARPITVTLRSGSVVWSNANVNENFPDPISPFLYSIAREGYYHYFRNLGRAFGISRRRLAAMESPLRQIIGVHGARMYYNLSNIHAVLQSAPFGDHLAASFNQFVGADEQPSDTPGRSFAARARGRISQAGELLVIAAKTAWQYTWLTQRVEGFERSADEFAARTSPEQLPDKSARELLDDVRGFIDIRCNRWNDAALADAGSMVCYGALQALLARAFPAADQQALHNTLLKALPGLVSSMPPLELWRLSRMVRADRDLLRVFLEQPSDVVLETIRREPQFGAFRSALDRYLDQWGFRCSAELMLTVPSFQEVPQPVIDLLKAYITVEGESPIEQLDRQQRERLAETRRVLGSLRARRPIVATALRWTQTSIQLRERARLKQALLYSRLRRIVLALGARLADAGQIDRADDLFFLTSAELDAFVSGSEMFPDHIRSLVSLRRAAHADVTASTPADTLRLAPGEYLTRQSSQAQAPSTGSGQAHSTSSGQASGPIADAASAMRGVGACGGSTTGRATILADVSQSHLLSPGDVLITRQTDPGWGPVFPLIAGLVMERGGMLSHGAIIAREFGIPSVVGVKDATRLIPHGGTVTVDGDHGVVRLAKGAA